MYKYKLKIDEDIMERAAVVDVETNVLNYMVGDNRGSPFYNKNNIVLGGILEPLYGHTYFDCSLKSEPHLLFENPVWVGHNIKFDLHYIRKNWEEHYLNWLKQGGRVWDTQIVEYLISGHGTKYAKLNDLAPKYGGTTKLDKIKEYWDLGIDTADIPKELLKEYLDGDLTNTHLIYLSQLEKVLNLNQWDLVKTQMEALIALQEIEWNGMRFDAVKSATMAIDIRQERYDLEELLISRMKDVLPDGISKEVLPSSPKQISWFFFGGAAQKDIQVEVLDSSGCKQYYKSGAKKGQLKTKKGKKTITLEQRYNPSDYGLEENKNGSYSVNDETLQKMFYKVDVEDGAFIKDLLKYRSVSKDLRTYFDGYRMLTWDDGLIHANFNQCATATGRLSSTKPNLQNLSSKEE